MSSGSRPEQVDTHPDAGRNAQLQAVLRLAESCDYEVEHSQQVTRLALRLFDELQSLHGFGEQERFWLQCGGLLHDIGWIEGQRRHHKTALRIILETPLLPFDARARRIIGSIARYHRRALPGPQHKHFAVLDETDQAVVSTLASLLRVADGLDRTHRSVVRDLRCRVTGSQIIVEYHAGGPAHAEEQVARAKGKLLEQVFDRELVLVSETSKSQLAAT